MTDEAGWVALGVKPVLDRGFGSGLSRDLDPALARVGRTSGHKFGALMGKAAVAGAAGVIGLGFAAFRIGQDAFAEARESQKVGALTRAEIKATGGAANISAKQIDRLSNSIGKKAAIDDETIASGANLLLSFKNIRNEAGKGNRIFNRAAHETTDLAAAMAASKGGEVDLKSASIQVGKALNDPIKGVTALGRVGVTFNDQQKEQIKTLVEHGDLLGAQKIILRELTSEFGGAAKSQATMGDKVQFAWKNIEERLGTDLLPLLNQAEKAFLQKGVPAIEGWVDAFEKKGVPALKHFYDRAKPVAEDVLPKFRHVLSVVKDDLVIAAPYAKDLVDAFAGMPDWAQKALVGGGLAAFAGSKLNLGTALTGGKGGGGLLGLVSKSKPIPVFVVNGGGLPGVPTPEKPGRFNSIKGLAAAVPLPILPALGAIGAELPPGIDSHGRPVDSQGRPMRRQTAEEAAEFHKNPWQQAIDGLNKDIDAAVRHKIQPTFDILGLVEADAKVARLRARAEKPLVVPLSAKLDRTLADFFDDAFGGHADRVGGLLNGAGRRGLPGVNVQGDMHIHATDHKDFLRKAQAAGLGGRRS